jgi:hypothetical protein
MAEWQPLQTITELSLQSNQAAPVAPAAAPMTMSLSVDAADEGPSLAQQLAASQSVAPASAPTASGPSLSLVSAPQNSSDSDPPENESVWILRNGAQASGPFSFTQLKEKAKSGELEDGFLLWRPGWTDFSPSQRFPVLTQLRAASASEAPSLATLQRQTTGGASGLSTLIKKTGAAPARSAISASPQTESEATDPGIMRPKKASFLDKIKQIFAKKPAAAKMGAAKASAAKPATKSSPLKRLLPYVALLVLAAGGGGAYYKFFLMSPIAELEDVMPEAFEQMVEAARSKDPGQLALALSQGDLFSPKFYVGTNLPEGTVLTLKVDGVAGTLVNVIDFNASKTAPVSAHVASFEAVSEAEGKPIPMGDYVVTISASSGERLEKAMFLGGPKGPSYDRRLKQYQEKLQQGYDAEIAETRELVNTLKGLRDDYDKKLAEVNANPDKNFKSTTWKSFGATLTLVLTQLEAKLLPKTTAADVFYPQIFTELLGVLKQLQTVYAQEQTAIDAGQPSVSAAALASAVTVLTAQEQAVAQAVTKTPVDALKARGTNGIAAPTPPAPSAAAAPVAVEVAPAAPAVVAPPPPTVTTP